MYRAEHVRERVSFLLVTDDDAVEFRLVSCPVPGPGGQDHTAWREVRPEDPAERLERVDAFEGYVVATLRRGGDRMLRVLAADDLAGAGHRGHQPLRRRRAQAGAQHLVRRGRGRGDRRVPHRAASCTRRSRWPTAR